MRCRSFITATRKPPIAETLSETCRRDPYIPAHSQEPDVGTTDRSVAKPAMIVLLIVLHTACCDRGVLPEYPRYDIAPHMAPPASTPSILRGFHLELANTMSQIDISTSDPYGMCPRCRMNTVTPNPGSIILPRWEASCSPVTTSVVGPGHGPSCGRVADVIYSGSDGAIVRVVIGDVTNYFGQLRSGDVAHSIPLSRQDDMYCRYEAWRETTARAGAVKDGNRLNSL